MTIVRQSTLLVSVAARLHPPAKREGGAVAFQRMELCAGARVDVTGVEDDDECLCIGPGGHEVWIDRRWLP